MQVLLYVKYFQSINTKLFRMNLKVAPYYIIVYSHICLVLRDHGVYMYVVYI